MARAIRKVSTAQFIVVGELLEHAFPRGAATPDHLSHHCERAELALLKSIAGSAFTTDPVLAELLDLSLRD